MDVHSCPLCIRQRGDQSWRFALGLGIPCRAATINFEWLKADEHRLARYIAIATQSWISRGILLTKCRQMASKYRRELPKVALETKPPSSRLKTIHRHSGLFEKRRLECLRRERGAGAGAFEWRVFRSTSWRFATCCEDWGMICKPQVDGTPFKQVFNTLATFRPLQEHRALLPSKSYHFSLNKYKAYLVFDVENYGHHRCSCTFKPWT